MKIKEALREARSTMASKGLPDAGLEAEVLLRHSLSLERAQLYASLEEEYCDHQDVLYSMMERRLGGEPLAYILGQREFFGIPLKVNRHVMVPRQETEMLVEKTLELARARPTDHPCLSQTWAPGAVPSLSLWRRICQGIRSLRLGSGHASPPT